MLKYQDQADRDFEEMENRHSSFFLFWTAFAVGASLALIAVVLMAVLP